MSERRPPHNEEAERGVLGSVLQDAARVMDLCVAQQITPEAFYLPAHRELFEVLRGMHEETRPIDILTVSDRLREAGKLDLVDGVQGLNRLVDETPTPAHADYYISLVFEEFLLRRIIDTSRNAIDECYKNDEPAAGVLGKAEEAFFALSDSRRMAIQPWRDLIKHEMEEIDNLLKNKKGITGVPTGYRDLDNMLLGFQPADMIVLAARPSMGKTALALNIAENVALGVTDHQPRAVGVFSLEMSAEALTRRMICSHAHVSAQKLSRGFISKEQSHSIVQAADKLGKAQIFIDDTAGLEAVDLRGRARRLKRKYNIQLVIVDYLQIMNYSTFAREGKQMEVAKISQTLKAMAKELKLPVLVLSQLNRSPETRDRKSAIPKLSDLRDSGAIEQDADVVMLLRRPAMYPEDEHHEDKTMAIVDVAKHRNGPTGEVFMNFESEFTRFENRERGVDGDPAFGPGI